MLVLGSSDDEEKACFVNFAATGTALRSSESTSLLLQLTAVFVMLVFGLFFLAKDGQVNAFAVYLLALLMIACFVQAENRAALKQVLRIGKREEVEVAWSECILDI